MLHRFAARPCRARSLAAGLALLFLPALCRAGESRKPLTMDERIEAQRAVERVYWSHRIWPKENPTPKPELGEVLPEIALRARVDEGLQKSAALGRFWKRSIEPESLQAEMNRMAERTQNPEVLRELFAALHDDPVLIAETLVRPALADRLLRGWYAAESGFHGGLRRRAEAARDACATAGCMRTMGGEYNESTWTLRSSAGPARRASDSDDPGLLDGDAWSALHERLAGLAGGRPDNLALLSLGPVIETPESYSVTAVLSLERDRIRTASVTFAKTPFETWWGREQSAIPAVSDAAGFDYTLPQISAPGCVPGTWTPTRDDHPPIARVAATSVWTGTEMLVWGGINSFTNGGVPREGGRYNPSTDTWTPLSFRGSAPLRKFYHSAIWTGTEMIVWGGRLIDDTSSNAGARYNPATDVWTPTSVGGGAPSPRYGHTAVWTGSQMVIWGGQGAAFHNTGARYTPGSDSWSPMSQVSAPSARSLHAAVWTGSRMLVWGGTNDGSGMSDGTGGRYNPGLDTWAPMSTVNAPPGRIRFSAVWSGAFLLVYGGSVSGSPEVVTDQGGRYDPVADIWGPFLTVPSPPQARMDHTAVWTGTEMIVWGGNFIAGSARQFLNSGGRYNPATNTWSAMPIPGGNVAREGHVAAWTGSDMVVWGGLTGVGETATGGRYSPATNSWTPTSMGSAMPAARRFADAIWTGAEMILWGGTIEFPRHTVNNGGRYDPATDSWRTLSTGPWNPSPRGAALLVWTGSNMIVWGGWNSSRVMLNDGGRYDPTTDTWSPTSTGANVPVPRIDGTAVWSGTEMIAWGGYDEDCELVCSGGCCHTPYNSGGRYNPATDSWLPTSTGPGAPSPRFGHVAVWTGSKMIVWAGDDFTGRLNDGGRYDPATDSWQTTSTGAGVMSPRSFPTGSWTGTEMLTWAGNGPAGIVWDAGFYNPATDSWRPATSTGAPHQNTLAVWTGSALVIWGGLDETGTNYLNIGSQYNVASDAWTPTQGGANLPYARVGQSAVWDGAGIICWGGEVSSTGDAFTDSGGRYCPCAGVRFYRDQDGDGHGDPIVSVTPCDGVAPAGYVAVGGDCNDLNGSMHPGAPEVCDGVDNDCDTFVDNNTLPPIPDVGWTGTNLGWAAQENAFGYDIVYGSLDTLRSTGGNFTTATVSCYGNDTELHDVPFPAIPGVGDGYWILVRGENCAGAASWDGEGPGQVGSRDAELAAAPNHCP
jgi:N-acetylneuraminic acid mutarotase